MLPIRTQGCHVNLFLKSISRYSLSTPATILGRPCYTLPPSISYRLYSSNTVHNEAIGCDAAVQAEIGERTADEHQVITSIHPLPPDMNSAFLTNFLWSKRIYVFRAWKLTGETSGLIQTSAEDQERLLNSIHDIQAEWGNLTAVPTGPAMTTIILPEKVKKRFLKAVVSSEAERISRSTSSSSKTDSSNRNENHDIFDPNNRMLFLSNIPDLVTMQITFSTKIADKHFLGDLHELLLRQGWTVPNLVRKDRQVLMDIGDISVDELKNTVMQVRPELIKNNAIDITLFPWTSRTSLEKGDEPTSSDPALFISSLSPATSQQDVARYIRALIPEMDQKTISRIKKDVGECTAVVSVTDHNTLKSILGLHGRYFGGHSVDIQIKTAQTKLPDVLGLEHEGWNTFRIRNLPSNIQEDQINTCLSSLGSTSPMKLLQRDSDRTVTASLLNPSEEARESLKRVHGRTIHGRIITIEILSLSSSTLVEEVQATKKAPIHQSPVYEADDDDHASEETGEMLDELSYLKRLFASYAPQYLQLYNMSQAKYWSLFKKSIFQDTEINTVQLDMLKNRNNKITRMLSIESELLSVREILYHPNCGLFTPNPFDFAHEYNPPYSTESAKLFYKEVKGYPYGSLINGLKTISKTDARHLVKPEWTAQFGRIVQSLVQSRASENYSIPVVKDLEKQIARHSMPIRAHIDGIKNLLGIILYLEYCRALYYQANQKRGQKSTNAFQHFVQGFDRRLETHKNNFRVLKELRNDVDNSFIKHGLQPCVKFIQTLVSNRAHAEYAEGLEEIVHHPTHGVNAPLPFDSTTKPIPPYETMLARSLGSLIQGQWWRQSNVHRNDVNITRLQTVLRTANNQKISPVYIPSDLSDTALGRCKRDLPKRMVVEVDRKAVKTKQDVDESKQDESTT